MNAVPNSDINFTQENSDTETTPEESPEYYEPLSNDEDSSDQASDNDDQPNVHRLVNGVENGMNYLDLSNDEEEEEEEEEEEDERMREAMQRAFREDENRRRAPLTPENTMRVMEVMRGIPFTGLPPDWAAEDRWMDQLATLRRSAAS